jgi:pyruvate formate lyase activating enzyme
MKICGFNKTTLLDYPGKVAATIFLGSCNFRCPFCHNGSLVLHPQSEPEICEEEILSVLKKRQGILEGVCVTGGEPTLSDSLPEFLKKIKALGYPVKLDTNGSHPEVMKMLAKENLIDMVAMDIKTSPARYPVVCGLSSPDMEAIFESVDFLINGTLPYEFRTTVVKELHQASDFEEIGRWLAGAEHYYLQAYKDSEDVLQPGFHSYSFEELESFRKIVSRTISHTAIRGID